MDGVDAVVTIEDKLGDVLLQPEPGEKVRDGGENYVSSASSSSGRT